MDPMTTFTGDIDAWTDDLPLYDLLAGPNKFPRGCSTATIISSCFTKTWSWGTSSDDLDAHTSKDEPNRECASEIVWDTDDEVKI